MDRTQKFAFGSLAVSLIVLATKAGAYQLTGSVALYSDAIESVINVATAVAAILAIGIAVRPADAGHPYGHHKAEYLSAVIVGALIIVAAVAILREAYLGFLAPATLDAPWQGIAVNVAATALNAVWSAVLVREGRKARSAALSADGKHLLADVVTSLGVAVGVGLVALTGVKPLDAGIAALVALYVLWSGWRVVTENVGGLMDEAAPPGDLERIRAIISENAGGSLEAHELRTRHAGQAIFIDFHLVVAGTMSVADAHGICDAIEAAVVEEFPGAVVVIHVEPAEKAKHKGVIVLG